MVNQFGNVSGSGGGGGGGGGVVVSSVALTGLIGQIIIINTTGVFHVQISSTLAGAPTLSMDITKRAAGDAMTAKNVMSWPAGDGCTLGISWNAGSGVQLSKSLATFDAAYTVVVIGTF